MYRSSDRGASIIVFQDYPECALALRPDLSVHDVPPPYHEAVIDLFERFIEFQAFGGIIAEGQEIRMRSLPPGMTCHHGGDLDDPDFNNVHVEITPPRSV